MTWTFGSLRERSRAIERVDRHDVTDEQLNALFDFSDGVARWLRGYAPVLGFLRQAAGRWNGPVSILDLGCGRGALSRAIVEWAHARRLDVKVNGADRYGRVVHLARDRHKGVADLTFDTRDLNDPLYLQAQQFDYVVSAYALHREPDDRTQLFLKTANRLARRGVIVVDWLRDARAAFYLSRLARFSKDAVMSEEASLAVARGFTRREADQLRNDAGLDFAEVRAHVGYRFSIAGERALVLRTELSPNVGLAAS